MDMPMKLPGLTCADSDIRGGCREYAEKYASGQENGTNWVPAEGGCFYSGPAGITGILEDHKVKSLPQLLDI